LCGEEICDYGAIKRPRTERSVVSPRAWWRPVRLRRSTRSTELSDDCS